MTEFKNILVTDRLSDEAFDQLREQKNFLVFKSAQSEKLSQKELKNIHALIIRSRTPITAKLLEQAPQLQMIVTATSGFDHIDLDACEQWGITVMHTPMANAVSASELTWTLLLNLCRKIQLAQKLIHKGQWKRELLIGTELAKKQIGIVGLGRIGSRVAQMAQAFDMKVVAFDPYKSDSYFKKLKVERMPFEALLATSDVLTFHVPKTNETHQLLSEEALNLSLPQKIIINTSRGSVIDEKALIKHLKKNPLTLVGLDVFAKEPLATTSALLKNEQVLTTPHIGATTREAFLKASLQAVEKTRLFFYDGSTSDTLNTSQQ